MHCYRPLWTANHICPTKLFSSHQTYPAFHSLTHFILSPRYYRRTQRILSSNPYFSLFPHVSFNWNTMGIGFFKSVLVSRFGKALVSVAFALKLPSTSSLRSATKMSPLGTLFSAMPVLTAKAALFENFAATISFALRTPIRLSLGPREFSVSSGISPTFFLFIQTTKSQKCQAECVPAASMTGSPAQCKSLAALTAFRCVLTLPPTRLTSKLAKSETKTSWRLTFIPSTKPCTAK